MSAASDLTATDVMKAIVKAVEDFMGDQEQADDLTLFVIKRL
jgi:serine phosphatase RsbU (regulator of sigma subunit)